MTWFLSASSGVLPLMSRKDRPTGRRNSGLGAAARENMPLPGAVVCTASRYTNTCRAAAELRLVDDGGNNREVGGLDHALDATILYLIPHCRHKKDRFSPKGDEFETECVA
jgi:hypothetical protein